MEVAARVRALPRLVNPRSELFASTFTYGTTACVKLVSSLVLTRLLDPAAYGIFGILMSLVFIIELVSDVGITALVVRHPRGGEQRFLHTIWTIRLGRSCINGSVMFLIAPLIAYIYGQPVLTHALRLFSLQFFISGLESMSYIVAQRDRRARISNYADMLTNVAMTVFVIGVAFVLRSYLALIYGVLLQRTLTTVSSHFFYRNIGVGFAFDREAFVEQFRFARYVMPSSLLTIVLSQYDKLILLKLFNLSLVGIYSIAGNMLATISGVITHNARVILYARCSEYFRTDRARALQRYYEENRRLLWVGVLLPALVGGFGSLLIAVLYDPRYAMVGPLLVIMALGTLVGAFQNASENVLVASGRTHMVLVGNVIRLVTSLPATLIGYFLFGLWGFVWFGTASTVVLMVYFLRQQAKFGLLQLRNELRLLGVGLLVFLVCLLISHTLLKIVPPGLLHLGLHRHHTLHQT